VELSLLGLLHAPIFRHPLRVGDGIHFRTAGIHRGELRLLGQLHGRAALLSSSPSSWVGIHLRIDRGGAGCRFVRLSYAAKPPPGCELSRLPRVPRNPHSFFFLFLHGPLELNEEPSPGDKDEDFELGEELSSAELEHARKASGLRGELDKDPFAPRRVEGRATGRGRGAEPAIMLAVRATSTARGRVLGGGMRRVMVGARSQKAGGEAGGR